MCLLDEISGFPDEIIFTFIEAIYFPFEENYFPFEENYFLFEEVLSINDL